MSSNIDRAAAIIEPLITTTARMSLHAETFRERAHRIARALADAGLLAVDRLEYGITFADESTVYWVGDDRDAAEGLREAWIGRGAEVGPLVCRRVSEPWEVTDE